VIFQRPLLNLFKRSNSTKIIFDGPDWSTPGIEPTFTQESEKGMQQVYQDLDCESQKFTFMHINLDLGLKKFFISPLPVVPKQPDFSFHRHLLGYALDKGQLRLEIRNTSSKMRRCRVVEIYPWQMRLFVSSIRLSWYSTETNSEISASETTASDNIFSYSPCLDRQRPSLLEREFILPPHQSLVWTMDFDKKHTHYSEYPMDPNRGIDIP